LHLRPWLLPGGLGEAKPRPTATNRNPKTGHLDLLIEAIAKIETWFKVEEGPRR